MVDKIYKISTNILFLIVAVMILSVSIQVINRNIFQLSLFWLDEIARIALVWGTFIGASIALKDKELIALGLLDNYMTGKAKRILEIVVEVIVFLFIIIVFIYSTKLLFDPSVIDQKTSSLQIPQSLVYLSLPISMLFMGIYTFFNLVQVLKKGGD